MDLQEIRENRFKLESQVLHSIEEFERNTDSFVESIDLTRLSQHSKSGVDINILQEISIKIVL